MLIYASIIIPIPSKLALHCNCTRMNVEFNYWSIELLSFSMMNFPWVPVSTFVVGNDHDTLIYLTRGEIPYNDAQLQSFVKFRWVDKFGNISSTTIYSIARSSNLWHSAGRQRACLEFISRFIRLLASLTFFFFLLLSPTPPFTTVAHFEY